MNILFAAARNAWGGFLDLIQAELPQHRFEATGRFHIDSLKGFDVLIPTTSAVNEEILKTGDCLRLIQQCGAGLEMVDIEAAGKRNIYVANVPTDISVQGIVKVVAENIIRVEMNKTPLYTHGVESIHELIEKQRDNAKAINTGTQHP